MPLSLDSFVKLVDESGERGRGVLRDRWIEECCAIVDEKRDVIEAWMPADQVPDPGLSSSPSSNYIIHASFSFLISR